MLTSESPTLIRRAVSENAERIEMAGNANETQRRIEAIAAQAEKTDWATLGAFVLEAAAIATAKHLAEQARCLTQKGSVVEPPATGAAPTA